MKTLQILSITLLLFAFNSCKTIKTASSKNKEIAGPTVIQKPVVADLIVSETKVTGTFSSTGRTTVNTAKKMAIADALNKAKADVLVEPQYEITKSFMRVDVTVKGYPANYKNFRPMEPKDTLFINTVQPTKDFKGIVNKSGRGGKIALISSGTAVVAGGLIFLWLIFY